jgi:hypothetical protein
MMQEEFSCHLIRRCRLFPLGSKHKMFLLRGTAAERSSGCKLIGGRKVDLCRHAGPDQIRSSRLRGRCSLASIIIALGIVLPVVATIGHHCIDQAGKVEILVYQQNRFINLKKSRILTRGGGLSLLKGVGTLLGCAVSTPLSNRWATNPLNSSGDRDASYNKI